MRLVGLMITRDDGWCLGMTIPAALSWVDHLVIMVHCPTMLTMDVVNSYADDQRVTVIAEHDPDWNEANYRQRTLEVGRELGGTHFAVIDGDEALTSNMGFLARAAAEVLSFGYGLRLPWLQLWRTLSAFRSDPSRFGQARVPLMFVDFYKAKFVPGSGNYQIHTRVCRPIEYQDCGCPGGVLHLQHVEWKRLLAKQALYKMVERMRWLRTTDEIENTYNPTVDEAGLVTTPLPEPWVRDLKMDRVVLGEECWQEKECKRLWQLCPERFTGLNLFGVVG